MTIVTGFRNTKNINTDRRVVDMSSKIALLQPNAAPLLVLTNRLSSRPTINPAYSWLEDDLQGRWNAVNNGAGYDGNATSVVVDDGTLFNAGDIVKNPRTAELYRVTSVSTNTLTIERAYGTTTAAALVDNDPLVIIGTAFPEGSSTAESKSLNTTSVSNYTQIFKTAVKVTKTQDASQLYGGNDRAYQRRKKAIEHAVDIERAFLFGEKSEHVSGSNVTRTTDGAIKLINANGAVKDFSSGDGFIQSTFEEWLETLFAYGSGKKVAMVSPRIITRINAWAAGALQVQNGATTFGLAVMNYVSAHGQLQLIKHPLLESSYNGTGVIFDVENIASRPLQGRNTKLNTNIQALDADYYLDEYITEIGFELKLPDTHGYFYGVS